MTYFQELKFSGIAEQTRQKLTELEGGKVDHKARLDLIKQIEDAIQKEKQLAEEKKKEAEVGFFK